MMKTYNCIVVFNHDKTKALFCRRIKDPFKGKLNFVGGKVEAGESEEDAAYRELMEETGLVDLPLRLVGIYSAPGRDPRGWTVSVAYAVCVEAGELCAEAGDDAAEARWFDVRNGEVILPEGEKLAFDHRQIINDAMNGMDLT